MKPFAVRSATSVGAMDSSPTQTTSTPRPPVETSCVTLHSGVPGSSTPSADAAESTSSLVATAGADSSRNARAARSQYCCSGDAAVVGSADAVSDAAGAPLALAAGGGEEAFPLDAHPPSTSATLSAASPTETRSHERTLPSCPFIAHLPRCARCPNTGVPEG
ncbi:hypothetical protein MIPYR_50080 [uncultured Microbacterium sp.]|uniref:Uncharacterized protein n=1 Tax=uncultured Microbacterium sp. TaxID=191216 RepID=A0A1Y5P8S9_9MICO|nr:hypothetical protein MIPYR_50080 [uncultured Microbacterium sp.]